MLRKVPGKLAVGTVAGNAIFATITGIGAVSAVTFSRIAYPQMRRHGYDRRVAFGSVAGSCVLSLFLPPAILVIIWATLTEQSVGRLFMAAVVPGLMLAGCFAAYCVWFAIRHPDRVPTQSDADKSVGSMTPARRRQIRVSLAGILGLMTLVLGGIWGGVFTPAEASASPARRCSSKPRGILGGSGSQRFSTRARRRRLCCFSSSPRRCSRSCSPTRG